MKLSQDQIDNAIKHFSDVFTEQLRVRLEVVDQLRKRLETLDADHPEHIWFVIDYEPGGHWVPSGVYLRLKDNQIQVDVL